MKYFLVIFLLFSAASNAEPKSFNEQLNAEFFSVLSDLQSRANLVSDDELAELLKYPFVSVDWESRIPGASATHGLNKASILVSAEMIKLLYFFAEINAINNVLSSKDLEKLLSCEIQYSRYINDQVARVFNGEKFSSEFSTYDSPEEFADIGHGCKWIKKHLPLDEGIKPLRDNLVRNAIAFIILHEAGHVLLVHKLTVNSNEIRRSILCASRKNEEEADQFAVEKIVEFGSPVSVFSNSYWSLGAALGSIYPSSEISSTHPSPTRRMANSFDHTFKVAGRLGYELDPRLKALSKQILELRGKLDDLLDSDEKVVIKNFDC